MAFVGLGLILLTLKYLAVAPVSDWSWWVTLAPFALAVVWWAWADNTGYTKRRAAARDEQRRTARRQRTKDALDSAAWQRNRRN